LVRQYRREAPSTAPIRKEMNIPPACIFIAVARALPTPRQERSLQRLVYK